MQIHEDEGSSTRFLFPLHLGNSRSGSRHPIGTGLFRAQILTEMARMSRMMYGHEMRSSG
jgi:hypothetical protein